MKSLFIYRPSTGTMIPLSDEVYLCNVDDIEIDFLYAIEGGATVSPQNHKGIRIDDWNMGNVFYGEGE